MKTALGALRPDPLRYNSVRSLLQAWLAYRKEMNPAFSLRAWSGEMGMRSHALLSRYLSGQRVPSLAAIESISRGLALDDEELAHLRALVGFGAAGGRVERSRLLARRDRPGAPNRRAVLEISPQSAIYLHWASTYLMALCGNSAWDQTALGAWQMLAPPWRKRIQVVEMQRCLEGLQAEGLLVREEGRWRSVHASTGTTNNVSTQEVRNYHRQAAERTSIAIAELSPAERELQSLMLDIQESQWPVFKEMVRRFRAELTALSETDVQSAGRRRVLQVNLHAFPMTDDAS